MNLVVYDLTGNTKDTPFRASLTEAHFLTISDGKFSPSCPAIESVCKIFCHHVVGVSSPPPPIDGYPLGSDVLNVMGI